MAITNSIYPDAASFAAAVAHQDLDMLIVDAWTFLHLPGKGFASGYSPHFTSTTDGTVGNRYLLLVRTDSPRQTLADLGGQAIQLFEVANTTLARHWLDRLLADHGLPRHDLHFGGILSVGKPGAAALPVFFGKTPACVLSENGFRVMSDLNPSVGKALRIVHASEPLVDGFICLRNSPWSSTKFKEDLVHTLAELHEEPAGLQILTMIRAGRLIAFEDRYLDPARRLMAPQQPEPAPSPADPNPPAPAP